MLAPEEKTVAKLASRDGLYFRILQRLESDAGRIENVHDFHESFFLYGQYRLLQYEGQT